MVAIGYNACTVRREALNDIALLWQLLPLEAICGSVDSHSGNCLDWCKEKI
jgi:hypothetical protein